MERLKSMKEALMSCVESEIHGNLKEVDAKELGEAVDMIKDLAEAIYYCTITEAMEGDKTETGKGEYHGKMYYNQRIAPMYHYPMEYYDPRTKEHYPDYPMYAQSSGGNDSRGGGTRGYREGMIPMDYTMYNDGNGMMYASGSGSNGSGNGGMTRNYRSMDMRDPKEGRSGIRRKMYMENKDSKDKTKAMQELENYMQELSTDLTEMIQDASPEEKQMLQQKISVLATKIK